MDDGKSKLLQNSLTANAIYTLLCGLVAVFGGADLAHTFGDVPPGALSAVGGFLIVVAITMVATARASLWQRPLAILLTLGDLGYVVASAGVIVRFRSQLSFAGAVIIGVVAAVVLLMVALQTLGLRRA